MEINLSSIPRSTSRKELENILIRGNNLKKWKYNLKDRAKSQYLIKQSGALRTSLFSNLHVKKVTGFKYNPRIKNCPDKYQFYIPKYYEVHKEYEEIRNEERHYNDVGIQECLNCDFLYEYNEEEKYITCLGNKTEKQRSKLDKLNKEIEKANKKNENSNTEKFNFKNYIE